MRTTDPTPDRRPLIYGICAVAILLVAAFLFWPQGEKQSDLVLTPELLRTPTVAGQESAAAMSGSAVEQSGQSGTANRSIDGAGGTGDVGVERVQPGQDLAAETHIDGEATQVSPQPAASPAPATESSRRSPARTSPTRPSESTPTQPSSSGEWVLNVGAYSAQANADRHLHQLSRLGISAHLRATSKDDGSPLYRVRIGYFPTSVAAQSYGEWLKRSQDIDGWPSKR